MRVAGRRSYAVDSETLWYLLHDPYTLRQALHDCVSLEVAAADDYRVVFQTRLGHVIEQLTGHLRFTPMERHNGYEFDVNVGNHNGLIAAKGKLRLESGGEDSAIITYEADIEIAGGFTQLSLRLLQTSMNAAARRSLDGLEGQVALRTQGYSTTFPDWDIDDASPLATLIARLSPHRYLVAVVLGLLVILLAARGYGRLRICSATRQRSVAPVLMSGDMAESSPPPRKGGD